MNAVKNSGYFPTCNAVVMLKIEARPGCTRTEGCSLAQEMNNNKDWILLRMLTFGFAKMISVKNLKVKNMTFVIFLWR